MYRVYQKCSIELHFRVMTGKKTKFIIGIDEVGRGPIAGPVTVCAFISSSTFKVKNIFHTFIFILKIEWKMF